MTAAATVSGTKVTPILFSAPMIRALLEGRKTQTRRVMKVSGPISRDLESPLAKNLRCDGGSLVCDWLGGTYTPLVFCPYGKPRDLLWVRETWADTNGENGPMLSYRAGGERFLVDESYPVDYSRYPNCKFTMWCGDLQRGEPGHSWRSPLHMPRWASRLTLELTDVRVERLQDISEADARAEGATSRPNCYGLANLNDGWSMDWSRVGKPSRFAAEGKLAESEVCLATPQSAFGAFVNELHGGPTWNTGGEKPLWDQNPWVWALSFRVHQQNIDAFVEQRRAA